MFNDKNETVCNCMNVTAGQIEEAIKKYNLKTVEEVGEKTQAGTGCGACQEKIQKMLESINNTEV